MWTFLLILVLVFAAVDLLVKYIIDPAASKKWKTKKAVVPSNKISEPSIGLVGATMYDGGKSKDAEEKNSKTDITNGKNGDKSGK
jgi:hypothetical protein